MLAVRPSQLAAQSLRLTARNWQLFPNIALQKNLYGRQGHQRYSAGRYWCYECR